MTPRGVRFAKPTEPDECGVLNRQGAARRPSKRVGVSRSSSEKFRRESPVGPFMAGAADRSKKADETAIGEESVRTCALSSDPRWRACNSFTPGASGASS